MVTGKSQTSAYTIGQYGKASTTSHLVIIITIIIIIIILFSISLLFGFITWSVLYINFSPVSYFNVL